MSSDCICDIDVVCFDCGRVFRLKLQHRGAAVELEAVFDVMVALDPVTETEPEIEPSTELETAIETATETEIVTLIELVIELATETGTESLIEHLIELAIETDAAFVTQTHSVSMRLNCYYELLSSFVRSSA